MDLASVLLFLYNLAGAIGCIPVVVTTTRAPVCCPPITTQNPPRLPPQPNTQSVSLDQCSVLRRFTRGSCPTEAILVCSRAPETTVQRVVMELMNGTTIVTTATQSTQAVLVLTCTSTGVWRWIGANNTQNLFTGVICSQQTLTSGDYNYDFMTS